MTDETTQPEVLQDPYRKYDGARQTEAAERYDSEHQIDSANVSKVEEDLVLHTPPGQQPGSTLPHDDLRAEDVDAAQFYGQEKPPLKENVNS
ncbi:hypothetical protein CCAX7_19500 [Capsulimonas corticalis]|uniref:Uncharacterized protein n=1 Tax=Capsulimonas corticalis TaxID=2219043 RepID=A0A402D2L8_9BACT|nr:hypothetical protein [Capsulimonas corticalis]BDI29899.1 hypothetical protein CCAX7_19500 [Capsulimonas corticalis]